MIYLRYRILYSLLLLKWLYPKGCTMKHFHVYGIGNALLDIDFEVSEETLSRLKIDKSVMTLIDEDRHHYLLQELDGIKHLKASGGSAANTICTMQQLGAKTFYSCKIGEDEAGHFFHRELVMQGIETNLHECNRDGVTGKCIVLVTPDADRTMNTFLGTTATFSKSQLSETAIASSEYLYIEGYLVASPLGCDAAITARQIARDHQTKVALTLSDHNMVRYFSEGLKAIIDDKVDILFCNEDEAMIFTNANDLNDATQKLKAYAKTFAVTLGSNGVIIYDGHEFSKLPAYQAKVVDTVGAGDVFSGAFLYGITHGLRFKEAADLANFAASKVIAKFGPRLNEAEIADVRRKLPQEHLQAVGG